MAKAKAASGRAADPAHRAIEVPLERLPVIDESSIEVEAPAEAVWASLTPALVQTLSARRFAAAARSLGCVETEVGGDLRHPGGILPGFVVARAVPPVMLALLGEHRYSRYGLIFRIDLLPADRSRVRAETRAETTGRRGHAFHAALVRGGVHRMIAGSALRNLKKRAEAR